MTIQLGNQIKVLSNFGAGPVIMGAVIEIEDHRPDPIIVYQDDEGIERWCYEQQITEVI
ncbi:MAG: hypothetical protein ACXWT0_01815 [Methylobacter sp.]